MNEGKCLERLTNIFGSKGSKANDFGVDAKPIHQMRTGGVFVPGEKGKTIEEQISELEAKKTHMQAGGATGRMESLQIEMQIQELREIGKRKN